MLLGILIPTLESRRAQFERIRAKLMGQIRAGGWDDRIEILSLHGPREAPTGTKRNALMERARGTFIVSVEDDDDVSERYIELVAGPTVLADGTLVACEQDYNGTQPYGRLTTDSFADLWFGPGAGRIRRIVRDDPAQFSFCRNCPYADRPISSCSVFGGAL